MLFLLLKNEKVNIEELYKLFLQNPSVATDTRKLKKGEMFFALSGPTFNGNNFALKALEIGASYAIVSEDIDPGNNQLIVVDNVLKILQHLAKYHRQQFTIPFIAITGSNGKPTTKDLVNANLSAKYKTYTTQGNLNNQIGIPLTLLSIKKDAEIAIIEMGANHIGEIESYCNYVLPTHGIITNCGKAHLEGFGGVEGVKKGKGELFDFLRKSSGTAIVFSDFDYLNEMSQGIQTYTYGTNHAEITGNALQSEPFLQVAINTPDPGVIRTNLVGEYNLPNILCAVATGNYFKVPFENIKKAIEAYHPDNSRSQMIIKGTNHIILDAYNANPSSMTVAINNLGKLKTTNKVVLLGAMMELGNESLQEHQQVVDLLNKYNWQSVVLVGNDFGKVKHSFHYFDNAIDARQWYQAQNFEHTYQLIKGSRSMKMEQILDG